MHFLAGAEQPRVTGVDALRLSLDEIPDPHATEDRGRVLRSECFDVGRRLLTVASVDGPRVGSEFGVGRGNRGLPRDAVQFVAAPS